MKTYVAGAIAIAMLVACGSAFGYYNPPRIWEDLSWWAESGATPRPVKDAVHPGYWWWPTDPVSNAGDAELWGNRGKIFHDWEPAPEQPEVVTPPPPPDEPQPQAKREVPVLNHVLFDFDKSVLKPAGKAEVDKAINWLKEWDQDTVVLEGHTCNIGTEQYNMGLGQRRANSVEEYMLQNNISSNRVETVSYGESQPAVPNTSPANRAKNRRVEIEIRLGD